MKTKLCIVIALFAIIGIAFIGCGGDDKPSTTHVHQWGAWVQTKAPTATEEGEETKTCATCGEKETRSIPKTTHVHDWGDWTVTTPATCTTAGEETRTCKLDASHKETRAGAAALGHDWGEWAVTKAPTTTAEGVETRTCKRDATHKETRPIAQLPDDNVVKERSKDITLFEGKTATVKGEFDKAGLDDAAKKIEDAIKASFDNASSFILTAMKSKYGKCEVIIVEKNPTPAYTYYKTIGDGKTIYLNFNELDASSNPQGLRNTIGGAIASMDANETAIDGVTQQPHDQTATITGLLDNNASATVKGYLTDTEWDGIAEIIKTAINTKFAPRPDIVKEVWRTVFSRGVTIIVEASPDEYTNWKTIGDGKTVYLSLAATNAATLDTVISPIIGAFSSNSSTVATIQPKTTQSGAG